MISSAVATAHFSSLPKLAASLPLFELATFALSMYALSAPRTDVATLQAASKPLAIQHPNGELYICHSHSIWWLMLFCVTHCLAISAAPHRNCFDNQCSCTP